MDPEGIKDLRVLLKRLAKTGVGILISSHNLSELENFCNRVCIISKGKILEEASILDLKQMDEARYVLKVEDSKKVKEYLTNLDKVLDKQHIEVFKDEEEVAEFIALLVKHDIKVYEVIKEELTLEEAFMKKSGGNKID